MSKCRNLLLGTVIALGLAAPALAEDVSGATVVATVGKTEITLGHMVAMTLTLPEEQRNLPLNVIFEGILERLIQQEAISQTQDVLTRQMELRLENERRSMIAGDVVQTLAQDIEVTDEALQAAYDKRFADFVPSPEYNASHILVETEEEAKAIIAELQEGADFADLARQKSTGPSGPGGGSLNWFGLGRMVPAFEAAVVELEVGAISAPVQTQFGWHVIKLDDTRTPGVPTLAEMKGELEQEVWREMLQSGIDTLVESVDVIRADVSAINPEALTDPTMLD